MGSWANISIGYDGEDETIHFGTRIVSEDSKGIFETYTLGTILPEKKVLQNPRVLAASHPSGHVCVAADRSFITFVDDKCSNLSFVHTFPSVIDCFAASDDGVIFVVGTGKEIYCIHNFAKDRILQARLELPLEDVFNFACIRIFVRALENQMYDIMMVGNKGEIFRIQGLNFQSLKETVITDSYDFSKHFRDVKIEALRTRNWRSEINSAQVIDDGITVKLILMGNEIILWSQEMTVSWILEEFLTKIKSFTHIKNSSLLLCLGEDGSLLTVCSENFMFLKLWKEMPIENFVVLEGISADDVASVLLLSKPDECGKCQIQLATFPGLEKKFSISVSSPAFLVSELSTAEDLLFLEGKGNSVSEFIQMLCLRIIVESQPFDRFQRLLRRHKFDDAKAFAVLFNLDVELVYKEQIKHLLTRPLSESCNKENDVNHLDEFIDLLNKVRDIVFVCEACLNAVTDDLTKTQMLLNYAENRLKKDDMKVSHSSKISSLQSSLWNMSNRLNTFLLIYKFDHSNLEWCRFSHANLINTCKQHLQMGEIHQATLVWSRHWLSFRHMLTEVKVKDLTDAIASEVRAPDMLPWLHHFIPSVMSTVPRSIEHIINKIIKSVKSLESERENWPSSGLAFAEEILDIMKAKPHSQLEICLNSYTQQFTTVAHLKQLVVMIDVLKELKQLKDNDKIIISLADFTQNKKAVVNILLRKVTPMNMKLLMTDFLSSYMLKNGLVPHTVLSECIHNILSFSANWWDYNGQAPWEETVSAIIPLILNTEQQINCIISTLKVAPVPWSGIISDIANRGLKLDHPSVELIRHEYKMLDIKVVQKKYGLVKLSVEKCSFRDLIRLIKVILKKGQKGMLEDALKFASISPKMAEETYILCIQHHIEQGNQDKALELLDSLKLELMVKCCERIFFRAQSFLESRVHCVVRDYYFEILSSLASRLKKAHEKSITTELPIQEMRNLYLLYQNFQKKMSLKEYCHIDSRETVLNECVKELMTSGDINVTYYKVENLCELLQLSRQEGVLEMIKHAINNQNELLVSRIISDFLHCDSLPKSCSEKLLKLIYQFLEASCNISHRGGGPQLAYNVASESCINSTTDSLSSWIELHQWTCVIQNLMAPDCVDDDSNVNDRFNTLAPVSEDSLSTWRFTPLYKDPAIFSNNDSILTFLKKMCRQFVDSRTLDFNYTTEELESVSRHLRNHRCNVGAMRLWCSLTSLVLLLPSSGETDSILSDIEMIAVHLAKTLLCHIIGSRRLDVSLGLALLFFLGNTFAGSWLEDSVKIFKQDHKKLGAVAQLGMLFEHYTDFNSNFYQIIHLKCTWAKKLAQYSIPYNMFLDTQTQNINILKSLMELKEVDIQLILEYCSDFDEEIQETLFLYLKKLLLGWEPKFEIVKTVDGQEKLIVQEIDSETEKKCKMIVDSIENKMTLAIELDNILNKVNFYSYEMYIYIISLLENLPLEHNFISKKLLLLFLKGYRRVQAPKQEELDDWHNTFTFSFQLPAISKWRLPFTSFMDKNKLWVILKQELNFNTYKEWSCVLDAINIQRDDVCSTAIKQSFLIRYKHANETWNIHSKDSLLLSQVVECVENISDLEKASACLYFVTNHMDPGADQVSASELCYKYILKWNEEGGHAQKYLLTVKNKYLRLSTTHILHKYGLAETCYLKHIDDPQELMSALFQHPSIISRVKGTAVHCPDINAAVDEIADVHKINSTAFRCKTLDKCLQPYGGVQQSQLDDTCDFTKIACLPSNIFEVDEENLLSHLLDATNYRRTGSIRDLSMEKREFIVILEFMDLGTLSATDVSKACYILKCSDEKMFAKYLVKIALTIDTKNEISVALRLRALQCLAVICSEEDLEKMTGCRTEEIRQMLKNLTYASQLEILGVNCSLSNFESCDKVVLVKYIWNIQSNNPQALTLIASICVEYDIRQNTIWEAFLKQMIKFSMVKDLEVLLLRLNDLVHIVSSSLYVRIWESVLLTPFIKNAEEEECIHSLILLQSCPVLHNINLNTIVEYSLQMRYPHLAAVILPFLKEAERNSLKKQLTRFNTRREITENLKHLVKKGVLIAQEAIPFVLPGEVQMNGHAD